MDPNTLPVSADALVARRAASKRLLWAESALREAVPVCRVPSFPLPAPHRSGHPANGKVNVEQLQNLQTVEA